MQKKQREGGGRVPHKKYRSYAYYLLSAFWYFVVYTRKKCVFDTSPPPFWSSRDIYSLQLLLCRKQKDVPCPKSFYSKYSKAPCDPPHPMSRSIGSDSFPYCLAVTLTITHWCVFKAKLRHNIHFPPTRVSTFPCKTIAKVLCMCKTLSQLCSAAYSSKWQRDFLPYR